MKNMTVGELKKLIADLPDDMEIMTNGYEGDYQPVPFNKCRVDNFKYVGEIDYMGSHRKSSEGVPAFYMPRC